jgi:hypothetical protein
MSNWDVTGPGRTLHSRFQALGDMSGKTADEIIAVVGPPTSRSSMAFGQMLLQWQATGCHMALLFDAEGRFLEISHEYAQYAPAPTGCMLAVVIIILALVPLVVSSLVIAKTFSK